MNSVLRGVTDKKVREVLRAAERAGCTLSWTGKGHIRVETPQGVYFTGGTPSDHRAATRLRAGLRARGVPIP